MKTFLLSLAVAFLLCSCATDTFTVYGHKKGSKDYYKIAEARMQADYKDLDLRMPGGFHLKASVVDHSTPTIAGGHAFAEGTNAMSAGVANAALALGSSGAFKLLGAGGSVANTAVIHTTAPKLH